MIELLFLVGIYLFVGVVFLYFYVKIYGIDSTVEKQSFGRDEDLKVQLVLFWPIVLIWRAVEISWKKIKQLLHRVCERAERKRFVHE